MTAAVTMLACSDSVIGLMTAARDVMSCHDRGGDHARLQHCRQLSLLLLLCRRRRSRRRLLLRRLLRRRRRRLVSVDVANAICYTGLR